MRVASSAFIHPLAVVIGDVTIGAVAVSGAPGGDKDAACANAALAKLADKLK